jgi:hypothetical protein
MDPAGLSIALGASIVRGIISHYAKDNDAVKDAAGDILDWAKDRLSKASDGKEIAAAADAIVRDLRPHIDRAGDEAGAVALAVAEAIRKSCLSPALIARYNLDVDSIAAALIKAAGVEARGLSERSESILRSALRTVAEGIVDIVDTLRGWGVAYPREVLSRLHETVAELRALRADKLDKRELQFFEDLYRDTVRAELDRFDFIGPPEIDLYNRHQKLTVSYVRLDVESYGDSSISRADRVREVGDDDLASALKGRELDIGSDADDEIMEQKRAAMPASGSGTRDLDSLLDRHRRVVVRGAAGAGKTTLLQWLAVQSSLEAEQKDRAELAAGAAPLELVPFFLRLRAIAGKPFPGMEKFIDMSVTNSLTPPEPNWIARQMKSGKAVVLIDGVDELPKSERDAMLVALENLLRIYPSARYVVSSRPAAIGKVEWPAWSAFVESSGFTQVTIRAMEMPQIAAFIDKWHEAVGELVRDPTLRAAWPELPGRLKRLLRDRPVLRRLAETPLLCTMICALHIRMRDNMPSRRRDLYSDCLEMMLRDRDDTRGIASAKDYPDVSKLDRRAFAQAYAFEMMLRDKADMPTSGRTGADAFFNRLVAHRDDLAKKGDGIRGLFVERCSILRSPVEGRVDFHHKTFQEFLAAEHAKERRDVATLVERSASSNWRETIVLAAGLFARDDCEALIEGILALPDRGPQSLITAFACLESDNISKSLRSQVIRQCRTLFPPKDTSAAAILASGGEKVVEWLEPTGRMAMPVRAACVHALTRIGSPAALEAASRHLLSLATSVKAGKDELAVFDGEIATALNALLADQPVEYVAIRDSLLSGILPLLSQPGGRSAPVTALFGRALCLLGDPRPGVGLRADGMPDIAWSDPIPAGEFLFGDDSVTRTVGAAYRIARYPVTCAQFQAFTEAADGYRNADWWRNLHPEARKQQGKGPGDPYFKFANHPREMVSWYEALAFCRWLSTKPGYEASVRLPTEVEWERAARGTDGRKYPWGNEFESARCNTHESGIGQTSAVGLFPEGASPCGALDMSGNVWEWTLTEYTSRESSNVSSDAPRVLRGGSWSSSADAARAAYRGAYPPGGRSYDFGFRVASPAEL